MAKKIEGYTTEFAQRRLPANGSVDFVMVPAAPNNSHATLVVHEGNKHERVFTESEVRAMALQAIKLIQRELPKSPEHVGRAGGAIARALLDSGISIDPA